MSCENRSPETAELMQLEPVPNDAVTKMTNTKLFSAARKLAIVSAAAFSPFAAIFGLLLLAFVVSTVGERDGVDWHDVLCMVVVVCFFARVMTEAVGAAFGLRRVDISCQVGLPERKASLKALSRVGTAASVLQWVIFGLLVCVFAWDYCENMTRQFPRRVDHVMIATMLLLCLIHTVALQMTAMGAKRYFNGTEDKKNSTACAVGLIISGLFELGNVVVVFIMTIGSDLVVLVFAPLGVFSPFFVLLGFVAHGASMLFLGILMIKNVAGKIPSS